MGRLSPHGHEPSRGRVGHARRAARARRVRRAARTRGCACRAPLASYDLEVAAGASLLATAYYAALTGFAVPAQRSLVMIAVALAALVSRRRIERRAARRGDARRRARLGSVRAAVGVVLAVVRRGRDPARARGAPAAGARVAGRGCGAARAPRSSSCACNGGSGSRCCRSPRGTSARSRIVGPLVNLVAIPFFNLVPRAADRARDARVVVRCARGVGGAARARAGSLAGATVRALHAVARVADRGRVALPLPPWPALAAAALGVALAVGGAALPGRRLAWLALLPVVPAGAAPRRRTAARASSCSTSATGSPCSSRRARTGCCSMRGRRRRRVSTAASRSCLPALAAGGRRGLDRLIVSHADNDHAGGAAAIVAAFPGVDVLKGPDVAQLRGRICVAGDAWEWDGVRFSHPASRRRFRCARQRELVRAEGRGGRELAARHRRHRAARRERRARRSRSQPTSSSCRITAARRRRRRRSSRPSAREHAIVSAGYANRWGFPRPEVRERWQQSGASVIGDRRRGRRQRRAGARPRRRHGRT